MFQDLCVSETLLVGMLVWFCGRKSLYSLETMTYIYVFKNSNKNYFFYVVVIVEFFSVSLRILNLGEKKVFQ